MRLSSLLCAALVCAAVCSLKSYQLCEAGELTGNVWIATEKIKEDDENKSRIQENLNLNFQDNLSATDKLYAYLNMSNEKRSDRDYSEFKPSASVTISGTDYRATSFYSEFRDKGYQAGTGTLKTENFFSSFNYEPEVLPSIGIEYGQNTSLDNLAVKKTNSINKTQSIRLSKSMDALNMEFRHQKTMNTNQVTGNSTVFFSSVSRIESSASGN
ncbi:MAG: hypothetical protein L0922_08205, partial [Candidatus Mariimomonas ferrooxydans]